MAVIFGTPVIEARMVPKGEIYVIDKTVYANPGDWITRGGRPPFWTRNMLGVREAERYERIRSRRT